MKRVLPLAALTLALLAAGCGSTSGSGGGSPATATTDASGALVVDMKNIQFVPADVTAKVGQKVVWKNLDSVAHNVKADSGASFSSSEFGQGGSYAYTPTKAGTIKYECTLHPGMVGTLTVR